jgi:hypothetical protein
MTTSKGHRLDPIASRMLEVTEQIHTGLLGGGALDAITLAYEEREVLFADLQAGVRSGDELSAAGRVFVERVRALDAEVLAIGGKQSGEIRSEQYGLHQRRTAIAAHTTRGREEPRLITVKA